MVIMEALALGRPVISTYVAGIPELVEPGKNGWLVPAGAIEPLVDAMSQALSTDSDELERMGRAGSSKGRQPARCLQRGRKNLRICFWTWSRRLKT